MGVFGKPGQELELGGQREPFRGISFALVHVRIDWKNCLFRKLNKELEKEFESFVLMWLFVPSLKVAVLKMLLSLTRLH